MTPPLYRSTVSVFTAGAALTLDEGGAIRLLTLTLLLLAVCAANAAATTTSTAWASAYSPESSGTVNGCDGSRLHDADLTFASLIVPCGARVRFCVGRRCVTATRRDSGPYVPGRLFDLNLGIVRALGFSSCSRFGVRQVRWSAA